MKYKGVFTKMVAVAGAASMLVLAGCGGSSSAKTDDATANLPDPSYEVSADTPAWKLDKTKDTKLTWYVNADWWNKSWGEDLVTKQIKEDLNLDVEFITGDNTKLNTFFASGDMPDLITIFDSSSQVAQTANKWALPLQDLAKKYDPYFTKVAQKQTLDWYKLKDGKTYGYPSYSNTSQDYEDGTIPPTDAFIIRKDVLDAIGDVDFKTPEGFVSAMKTIKEKFPDLVPFGFNSFDASNSSLDATLQNMLGVPIIKDGKFYERNLDEDYVTWLKALRQVHQDGNISDDSFADDEETLKEKVSSGKYATMLLQAFHQKGTELQTWMSSNPGKEYVAVDAMESAEGNEPTLSQTGLSGWTITYISKKTKNPAKAMQLYTYLLDDPGQYLVNFGIEGKTYTKNSDGTVSWTDEANEVRANEPEKFQKEWRIGEFVLFSHDRYKALNKDSYVQAIRQMQDWGRDYLKPQFEIENISPDANTPQSRSLSAINTNWSTTLVSMIRAESEKKFDELLTTYEKFEKDNGIDQINKIRDEKIAANMKRLGE
ncbi:type 2 periplasmic-binding domain-containing protein [Bifidobacterium breve]|uniref:ABC transporter n=1 Tax=Bifidobacterium breve TaxID=1685 RepID=Q2TM39_BIFBR|nr:Solute-binding protein of ABC transporter system for sugars [Bifidobacterium breve]AAY16480.1 ABC transporter [Bifidobacterium breve]ABE95008.1 Solute binding protein of ABC transporter system for sugars [Bifidobacterium breve UCC2003]QFV13617.1 sugar ABC transporter substrate-binding protein [Bifidobacterium breve]SPU25610.1 Maltose-binding periplasmic proteins/domains [Bifidobacterium bifidum]